ncbi:MAG: MBL fold metallo-hydrolase [Clostridiales Family XIII bacterium]|jgi:L-ascorbate metabolism protein UlaG (beta-lactamase superfamily)|nr:MBL fold metallo-hydrolase [Clostridiales Family XIII bacterium]
MKFTQIRHATCIIEVDNVKFLLDPILYKKSTLTPIKGGIDKNNPLVDISVDNEVLKNIDVILLTHLHRDHFDPEILNFFGKDKPVVCCADYHGKLTKAGFENLIPVKEKAKIENVEIILTHGKHGTGAVGISMGKSYGFILKAKNEGTVYITGDTIWCKCVERAIENYKPKYVIGFSGAATIKNTHITLNESDIKKIMESSKTAKIIINHMDAWNHCFLTRDTLKEMIQSDNLYIPNDGETIIA